jgi:hypothetical protein
VHATVLRHSRRQRGASRVFHRCFPDREKRKKRNSQHAPMSWEEITAALCAVRALCEPPTPLSIETHPHRRLGARRGNSGCYCCTGAQNHGNRSGQDVARRISVKAVIVTLHSNSAIAKMTNRAGQKWQQTLAKFPQVRPLLILVRSSPRQTPSSERWPQPGRPRFRVAPWHLQALERGESRKGGGSLDSPYPDERSGRSNVLLMTIC